MARTLLLMIRMSKPFGPLALLLGSLLTASVLAGLASATTGCGGCPWTKLSALEVTPARPCLDLQLADGADSHATGGCVNPVVYGRNNCESAVTVPGAFTSTLADQTFEPGADIQVEVPLETSTQSHGDNFAVPFLIGSDTVIVSFRGTGGTDD